MRILLLTMSLLVFCSMAPAILIHSEDFSAWEIPAGWQSVTTGEYLNCCRVSQSNWAGGTPNEIRFYAPSSDGFTSLVSVPIDIQNRSAVKISFKIKLETFYNYQADIRFRISSDSTDWTDLWTYLWERDGNNMVPQTLSLYASNLTSNQLYVSWLVNGAGLCLTSMMIDDLVVESTPVTLGTHVMPVRCFNGNAAVYQDDIYHAGGVDFISHWESNLLFKYSPNTDIWTELSPMPDSVAAMGVSAVGNKIVVAGGGDTRYSNVYIWAAHSRNSTFVYTPDTDSWTYGPALPESLRWCRTAAYADRYLYLAGGYWDDDVSGYVANSVYMLDCQTMHAWETATPLPQARLGGAFACSGNKLIYVGGVDSDLEVSGLYFIGQIDAGDPRIITWSQSRQPYPGFSPPSTAVNRLATDIRMRNPEQCAPYLNSPEYRNPAVFRINAAVWNENMFIIAGGSTTATDNWDVNDGIQIYNPLTDSWTSDHHLIRPCTAGATVSRYDPDRGWLMYSMGAHLGPGNWFDHTDGYKVQVLSESEFTNLTYHDAEVIVYPECFPASQTIGAAYQPWALVRNLSAQQENALIGIDAMGYHSEQVISLDAFETQTVYFDPYTPMEAVRLATATINLTLDGDIYLPNNSAQIQYGVFTEFWWIDALPVLEALKSGGGLGYKHPVSGTEYYYLFGGNTGNQSTDSVLRFDINYEGEPWTYLQDMPSPRQDFAAALIGDYYYVIGGRNRQLESYDLIEDTVFRYDLLNDYWTTVAPLPVALWNCSAAAFANRFIFVLGGRNADSGDTASVYMYDSILNTWSEATSLPSPRSGGAFGIVGNKAVYAGGYYGGSFFSTLWTGLLDENLPNEIVWSVSGNYPGGNIYQCGVAPWGRDGLIFAGGMDVPDTEVTISKQVWTYVPDNQEWCRMPDMIQAVYASAPGSINYAGEYWNLVVMGGSGEAGISDFCQIMDGRVQLTTIAAPAIQIESNGQMIHLLWSPVSGASSYKVLKADFPGGPYTELIILENTTDVWIAAGLSKSFYKVLAVSD